MLIRIVTILLIVLCVYFVIQISAEKNTALVVYISIDQMRYDYLERFKPYFASSGFRLLLEKGANFRNCNYEHYCTYTGPGHACLGTSCYSGKSGIMGNRWYVRNENVTVYCVDDLNYLNTENPEDKNGGKSAERLIISTLGDELKNNDNKSKVFSVSGKDRAAILMLGKKLMPHSGIIDQMGILLLLIIILIKCRDGLKNSMMLIMPSSTLINNGINYFLKKNTIKIVLLMIIMLKRK